MASGFAQPKRVRRPSWRKRTPAIAIFTWNYGTGRLGITAASLFLNLSPVFAALLGMALGAEPSWAELVGGGIAIAGVLFLQLGGRTRFG